MSIGSTAVGILRAPARNPRAATVMTTFPAVARSVRAARNLAAELAAAHGGTPEQVEDVRLAVSEAATNVVVHAYEQTAPGTFRLRAVVGAGQLEVTIDDDGRGLSSPARTPGLGAGLKIMEQLAEPALFREREGGGTTVALRFALGR